MVMVWCGGGSWWLLVVVGAGVGGGWWLETLALGWYFIITPLSE